MSKDNLYDHLKNPNIQFVDEITDDLKCKKCKYIMELAHAVPCGCCYCLECIKTIINSNNAVCIMNGDDCKENILRLNKNVFPSFPTIKKIECLRVVCLNNGCEEIVQLKEFYDHLNICQFTTNVTNSSNMNDNLYNQINDLKCQLHNEMKVKELEQTRLKKELDEERKKKEEVQTRLKKLDEERKKKEVQTRLKRELEEIKQKEIEKLLEEKKKENKKSEFICTFQNMKKLIKEAEKDKFEWSLIWSEGETVIKKYRVELVLEINYKEDSIYLRFKTVEGNYDDEIQWPCCFDFYTEIEGIGEVGEFKYEGRNEGRDKKKWSWSEKIKLCTYKTLNKLMKNNNLNDIKIKFYCKK